VVHVAADLSRLRLDRPERQAAPLEHPVVGVVHQLVAGLEALDVGVERVGVLHEELAAAEQPEPGAQLVAIFPADLIHVDR
jgi:hypothetical protein